MLLVVVIALTFTLALGGGGGCGFSVGDFTGVKILHGKCKPTCYVFMAEIVEVGLQAEQKEALVKYLVRCASNLYRWPDLTFRSSLLNLLRTC